MARRAMILTAPMSAGAAGLCRVRLMAFSNSGHHRRRAAFSSLSTLMFEGPATAQNRPALGVRTTVRESAPTVDSVSFIASVAGRTIRCAALKGAAASIKCDVSSVHRGLHTRKDGVRPLEDHRYVSVVGRVQSRIAYSNLQQFAHIQTNAKGKQGWDPRDDSKSESTFRKAKAGSVTGSIDEEQKEEVRAESNAGIGDGIERLPETNKGNHLPSGAEVKEKAGKAEKKVAGIAAMRERLRNVGLDAREDARDWIRDKRDDVGEIQEVLRDARKEGRLRQQLSEQAKEGRGKLKELWHKYGAVGIGCYIGIYFGTVGILYVVYDYGVMTSMPSGGAAAIEKMQEWMKHTPEWSQKMSDRLFGAMANDHRARSFVLAWATSKILEPLRLVATIAVTPTVARALGRAPTKGGDNQAVDGNRENKGEKGSGKQSGREPTEGQGEDGAKKEDKGADGR